MGLYDGIPVEHGGDHVGENSPMSGIVEPRPKNWVCNVLEKGQELEDGSHADRRITTNAHERRHLVLPCRCAECVIKDHSQFTIGEPAATVQMSVEDLKNAGYVGLYDFTRKDT